MRFAITVCACFALAARAVLAADAPATTQAASADKPAGGKAAIVVLEGEIDDFNKASVIKRFDEARELGAKTIILQVNTYGGLVTSGLEISAFLKRQNDLHVIAYVEEKAISAGAMISLACNEIVMQPGSKIGDCAPIALTSTGELQTLGETERAKMESPILADFEESALRNGYDPLLAASMVSVGKVVHWVENSDGQRRFVDGETYDKLITEGWTAVPGVRDPVDAEDTLFTTNADMALKLGLASAIEASPQSLAADRGLTILVTLQPSGGERIIGWLGSGVVRGLLTTVFMLALYMAFSHPGHGAPEAVAAITLAVLVGVPLLTGYAQWWEILAIVLGVILLAVEIFIIPGFGVAGISGIMLILFGLTMTWVGDEPIGIPGFIPKLPGTWHALEQGLYVVVGGMLCSLALWFWLQRYLPKLPYFNKLILTTVSGEVRASGNGDTGAADVATWPAVGARGRTMTDLRPGGTAAFHDAALGDLRPMDVVCDSGFIAAGTDVVVREVHGNHVVVRTAG